MSTSAQTEKFLSKFRDLKTAVFIDSANLFYAQKRVGWKISWKKLYAFLNNNFKIYKDKFVYKCDFDVEISLDVAEKIDKLVLVIIASGDSDFLEIKNFCLKRGKKFLALCFERNVAWELRLVHHLFFEKIRKLVEK